MKLYDIPKESRIRAEIKNGEGNNLGEYIVFHRLDGRYSYCTVEGTEKVCHLSANQELKLSNEGYYELA